MRVYYALYPVAVAPDLVGAGVRVLEPGNYLGNAREPSRSNGLCGAKALAHKFMGDSTEYIV